MMAAVISHELAGTYNPLHTVNIFLRSGDRNSNYRPKAFSR
jgi:hypothetical protein